MIVDLTGPGLSHSGCLSCMANQRIIMEGRMKKPCRVAVCRVFKSTGNMSVAILQVLFP